MMLSLAVINKFLPGKVLKKNNLNTSRHIVHVLVLIAITLSSPVRSEALDPNGNVLIKEENNRISISAHDVPFVEILKSIERYNGTSFKGVDIINNHNISINLSEASWNKLFGKLLRGYSWISDTNKTKLDPMTIYILPASSDRHSTAAHFPDESKSDLDEKKSVTGLTKDQLTRVSNGRLRSPLPIDLFSDNQIKAFLNTFGIMDYEDLNDTQKAMKARSKARHELRRILK